MALAGHRSTGELEDAELRRLILDLVRCGPSAEEFGFLARAARESGFGALHSELLVQWIGRYPEDPYARFLRLEDRLGETRPTAIVELDAILKAAPDHEEARALRDALARGK